MCLGAGRVKSGQRPDSFSVAAACVKGASVYRMCVNTSDALFVGGPSCVWGTHFLSADLLHIGLCNHIGSVNLVFCTSVVLFSSLARPAHAGQGGERTGCHHCCVFKNSLQAAFQITSAAN